MTLSSAERRLRPLAAKLPAPPTVARTYEERYQQIAEALVANTATEADIRWIYDNVSECAPALKAFLLAAAEKVLADPRRWRDYGYLDASALKILATPLGASVPEGAYPNLKAVADCLSFEPDEKLKAFFTATRPFHIRAIFLMLALGTPDGLALRQELAQRLSLTS